MPYHARTVTIRRLPGRAALALLGGLAAALATGIAPAAAQGGTAGGTLQKPDADAPKQSPSLPSTGESLSQRLDRTDGVITPPAGVDRGMHVAPKDPTAGQNMPVIPPPGRPGGNPTVQPK